MNEQDILGRIKNADPAANLEIDETLIEGSIASGSRKAKAARRRNSFFAAAGSGALALAVFASMSFGPSTQQSLITLGEGSQQGGQQTMPMPQPPPTEKHERNATDPNQQKLF